MTAHLTGGELIEYARQRSRVEPDGCWYWRGAIAGGSGRPMMGLRGVRPRSQSVQRVLWQALHPGWTLRHDQVVQMTCGELGCVHPEHIRIVSKKEAMRQAAAAGKLSRGVRHSLAVTLACRAREHVRLSLDLARQIRARYRETGNAAQVAREFGVHPAHAHRIVTNQAWREPSPWAI